MIRGIAFLVASVSAFAQAPLAFEVASVKPSGPLDPVAIQSGKMRIGMKVEVLFERHEDIWLPLFMPVAETPDP